MTYRTLLPRNEADISLKSRTVNYGPRETPIPEAIVLIRFTIKAKSILVLTLVGVVALATSGAMVRFLERTKTDTDVVVALARQRVLTQTMAKSALGYVMAKSGYQTMEQKVRFLDGYITRMREELARRAPLPAPPAPGQPLPSAPGASPHPGAAGMGAAPDAVTQAINRAFGQDWQASFSILGVAPLNPAAAIVDPRDLEALAWLRENPGRIRGVPDREAGELFLRFYAVDQATDPSCLECHRRLGGRLPEPGGIMGLRLYLFRFSGEVALGKAELEPSLIEYYQARDLFRTTLQAMRQGGDFSLDPPEESIAHTAGIPEADAQSKMGEIEEQFARFTEMVQTIFGADLGSAAYLQAREGLLEQSGQLKRLSEELVAIYARITHENKSRQVLWATAATIGTVFLVILAAAIFMNHSVLTPLSVLRQALELMANGDLRARIRWDGSRDEIGQIGLGVNRLADHLGEIVLRLRGESASLNAAVRVMRQVPEGEEGGDGPGRGPSPEPLMAVIARVGAELERVRQGLTTGSAPFDPERLKLVHLRWLLRSERVPACHEEPQAGETCPCGAWFAPEELGHLEPLPGYRELFHHHRRWRRAVEGSSHGDPGEGLDAPCRELLAGIDRFYREAELLSGS
ncbi:MAG: methyl-accepting chemotaxis protein [Magnetococcales bacterium]|nr:methyl-accepting chemotaxis protein [Magnetococcales bacterium]